MSDNQTTKSDKQFGWPAGEVMQAQCPRCKTTTSVDIVRDLEVRPFDCDQCRMELLLYHDGLVERAQYMTMAERDHMVQESLARQEGVSYVEAAKWMPNRERSYIHAHEMKKLHEWATPLLGELTDKNLETVLEIVEEAGRRAGIITDKNREALFEIVGEAARAGITPQYRSNEQ